MRKLIRGAAVAAGAVALVLAGVAPASATVQSGISERTGDVVSAAPSPVTLQQLKALIGVQPQLQIDAIMASDVPATAFFDTRLGRYTAAIVNPVSSFAPASISPRGPGCATTDACAVNSTYHGYYGTGQLTFPVALPNVTKLMSGDKNTTFWYTGVNGVNMTPNKTVNVPSTTFVSITRS